MKTAGFGIFETMRFCRGKTVYFDAHLQRLASSARRLRIKLPLALPKLKNLISQEVKASGLKDAYLRLTIFGSPKKEFELLIKKYTPCTPAKYKKGFRVCISDLRQDQNSIFPRHKTTLRQIYETSYQKALKNGFAEALLLNQKEYLTEASRSNIFWAKDGKLFTPGLSCGCLNGITRKAIIGLARKFGLTVCQGKFFISDLKQADEAFLTNSLIGIMPLSGYGRRITNFLQEKYKILV